MILDDINKQYHTILNHLQDEESIKIFNDRIEYMITRDADCLEKSLFDDKKSYSCQEIDNVLKNEQDRPIIIWGCGICGIKTKKNLDRCETNYNVVAFCDNNKDKIGKTIEGISVISCDELKKYKNCIIIVSSKMHNNEIYEQLLKSDFPPENIVVPTLGYPEISCGWQYFDLFKPNDNEVFVDAGTYNGTTIVDYYIWLGQKSGKCFGLEPVNHIYKQATKLISDSKFNSAKLYNVAAWNCNEQLSIMIDQKADEQIWGGSSISDMGTIKVTGKSIDSILSENNSGVTFIKMDIEGSELKALEGAKKSIITYKPKLAISLYHKRMCYHLVEFFFVN